MAHQCDRIGCKHPGTFKVVIELRSTQDGGKAVSTPRCYVCAEHTDVAWDDVVTKDDWTLIVDDFARRGLPIPIKEYSQVLALPLSQTPIHHPVGGFTIRGLS